MCKKALLTFTVLALASLTAFAANKDGIVLSKDGRMTIATKPAPSVTRTERNEAGLVHIYDNLGTAYPKGEYWCCEGFTITGPITSSGAKCGSMEMAGCVVASIGAVVGVSDCDTLTISVGTTKQDKGTSLIIVD